MSLVLQSSGGGSVTITEPATASNYTATMPAATGTVMVSGNMPAFSATVTSAQSISGATSTKVAFNNEVFDTASCYNNTGSTVGSIPAYSFLPTVAGYYQVNSSVNYGLQSPNSLVSIYKNGSEYRRGTQISATNSFAVNVSALVYLNGTTDYINIYVYTGAANLDTGGAQTYFDACLVRAA